MSSKIIKYAGTIATEDESLYPSFSAWIFGNDGMFHMLGPSGRCYLFFRWLYGGTGDVSEEVDGKLPLSNRKSFTMTVSSLTEKSIRDGAETEKELIVGEPVDFTFSGVEWLESGHDLKELGMCGGKAKFRCECVFRFGQAIEICKKELL